VAATTDVPGNSAFSTADVETFLQPGSAINSLLCLVVDRYRTTFPGYRPAGIVLEHRLLLLVFLSVRLRGRTELCEDDDGKGSGKKRSDATALTRYIDGEKGAIVVSWHDFW